MSVSNINKTYVSSGKVWTLFRNQDDVKLVNWWEIITDITEEDVIDFVLLYNSFITHHNGDVKYYIKYKSPKFRLHKHYGDACNLIRFLARLNLRPREYFTVQFEYYKKEKKHPYARQFPSLKHLASPAALERWKNWLVETRKVELPSVKLTDRELNDYQENYLKDLIQSWKLSDETSLLKDIVLARNFPLTFLESRSTFKQLKAEKYYEQTYRVKHYSELFI